MDMDVQVVEERSGISLDVDRVVINGFMSRWRSVMAGVPQGSVL